MSEKGQTEDNLVPLTLLSVSTGDSWTLQWDSKKGRGRTPQSKKEPVPSACPVQSKMPFLLGSECGGAALLDQIDL